MAAENSALPSQEYIINVFKYILYVGVFSPTNLTVFLFILFYFILIVTTSSVEVNWIWGLKIFINQFSFSNFNNLVLSNI